jgi:hypothetical protein
MSIKKRFYTVEEFYELIGHVVTKANIYYQISHGKIPAKRFGNRPLLTSDWVEEFLNAPATYSRRDA